MKYPPLTGKCKNCGGCMRLEDVNFTGVEECKYSDNPIQEIKRNKRNTGENKV